MKNTNWKPHHVTCPKCGKSHHIFDNAAPSQHVRFAACGQAYYMHGGPIRDADVTQSMHRHVEITRALPVRELTAAECRHLGVHAHDYYTNSPEDRTMRRKALILRGAGENWTAYFSDATEASRIQQWIEAEKPMRQTDEAAKLEAREKPKKTDDEHAALLEVEKQCRIGLSMLEYQWHLIKDREDNVMADMRRALHALDAVRGRKDQP